MFEIKRVHGVYKLKKGNTSDTTGKVNGHYKENPGKDKPTGADLRQANVPKEYERKAKMADAKAGGNDGKVFKALKSLPEVMGLAIGAFGEMSSNFEVLIHAIAYEGALKKSEMFGSADPVVGRGIIAWYLKKKWSRLAVASATQCRLEGMEYLGGKAQQQSAARHQKKRESEISDEWAYDRENFMREKRQSAFL